MNNTIHTQIFSLIQELLICMRTFQKDAIFCEDVTFVQFNILHVLQATHSIEMIQLRNKLAVEKSTLTRLVEPLLQKSMITKELSDNKSILTITEQGKSIHSTVWNCIVSQFDFALSSVKETEKKQIFDGISGFTKMMGSCCTRCN